MNYFAMWRAASTNAHATNRPVPMRRTCIKMALTQLEVLVRGMDCAECTMHVQQRLSALPGVADVKVLLSSEKAGLRIDPRQVSLSAIRQSVEEAGHTVPQSTTQEGAPPAVRSLSAFI